LKRQRSTQSLAADAAIKEVEIKCQDLINNSIPKSSLSIFSKMQYCHPSKTVNMQVEIHQIEFALRLTRILSWRPGAVFFTPISRCIKEKDKWRLN